MGSHHFLVDIGQYHVEWGLNFSEIKFVFFNESLEERFIFLIPILKIQMAIVFLYFFIDNIEIFHWRNPSYFTLQIQHPSYFPFDFLPFFFFIFLPYPPLFIILLFWFDDRFFKLSNGVFANLLLYLFDLYFLLLLCLLIYQFHF